MQTNSIGIDNKKKPIILCVDDEWIILENLSYQLKGIFGEEYRIEAVCSAEQALQIINDCNAEQVDIPVILCDQVMPNLQGDDFFILIHKSNPNTRKIMLTGLASAQSVGKALNKANLYRYISKPWETQDLTLTVQEAVRSFYLDRSLDEKNKELERSFFYNRDTNLGNWEKLQRTLNEYSSQELKLTLAVIKIENYGFLLEYFGAKIYTKILLEVIEIISTRIIEEEEMFQTQQDEFLILAKNASNEEFIHKLSVFRLMLKSEYINVEELSFHVSVFISITNGHENLYSTAKSGLLHRHKSLSDSASTEPTNEIEFHKQNIFWGRKLNNAIHNKNVVPYFQGIMDNRTGEILKYECLVRIEDNGDIITPDKFLNLASAMGIVKLITIIVMDRSFLKFQSNDKQLSINLTQIDLEYKDFPYLVEAKMQHYGIDPKRVTFEILENISLNINSRQSLYTLRKLKDLGCKIAIDDFGVHYSNLARLLEIQPDYIKIDGWFIQNMSKNRTAYLVTKAIIELSHSLNAEVIAEFVSEKEIQEQLLELGVEYSQGFYIGKPSPEILD